MSIGTCRNQQQFDIEDVLRAFDAWTYAVQPLPVTNCARGSVEESAPGEGRKLVRIKSSGSIYSPCLIRLERLVRLPFRFYDQRLRVSCWTNILPAYSPQISRRF